MSAVTSITVSASAELSCFIPGIIEKDGVSYDLRVVARDAAGGVIDLKNRVGALGDDFIELAVNSLKTVAQDRGCKVCGFVLTKEGTDKAFVQVGSTKENLDDNTLNTSMNSLRTRVSEVSQGISRMTDLRIALQASRGRLGSASPPLDVGSTPGNTSRPLRDIPTDGSSGGDSRASSSGGRPRPQPLGLDRTPKKWSRKKKALAFIVGGLAVGALITGGAAYVGNSTALTAVSAVGTFASDWSGAAIGLAQRGWNWTWDLGKLAACGVVTRIPFNLITWRPRSGC